MERGKTALMGYMCSLVDPVRNVLALPLLDLHPINHHPQDCKVRSPLFFALCNPDLFDSKGNPQPNNEPALHPPLNLPRPLA